MIEMPGWLLPKTQEQPRVDGVKYRRLPQPVTWSKKRVAFNAFNMTCASYVLRLGYADLDASRRALKDQLYARNIAFNRGWLRSAAPYPPVSVDPLNAWELSILVPELGTDD